MKIRTETVERFRGVELTGHITGVNARADEEGAHNGECRLSLEADGFSFDVDMDTPSLDARKLHGLIMGLIPKGRCRRWKLVLELEEAPKPEKQHDVWGEAHLAGYGLSLGIRQMLHNAWKWALPPETDHLEAAWLRLLGSAVDVIQDLHSSATPADIVKETLRRHKLEPPTHDWLMAEQERIEKEARS